MGEPLLDSRSFKYYFEGSEEDTKELGEKILHLLRNHSVCLDFSKALKDRGWTSQKQTAGRLLDDIHTHQLIKKDDLNEWVQIGKEFGWSVRINNGKRANLIRRLSASGCIECDYRKLYNSYGSKAFCYKFTEEFHEQVVRRLLAGKPIFIKWAKNERKTKPASDELDAVFMSALKSNLNALTINEEAFCKTYRSLETTREYKKFFNALRPFSYISEGQIRMVKGRIYTPFIQLPREYRHIIKLRNDNALADIDIVACHPTFLYHLYKGETKSEKREMRVLGNTLKNGFYEFLQSRIWNAARPVDRDETKRLFNSFLNAREWGNKKIRVTKFNKVGKAFRKTFPILFDRIKTHIENNRIALLSSNGSPAVGIGLMALEMEVLKPVYMELLARGYWFMPAHDGFVVEKKGYNLAKKLADESLLKNIGVGTLKTSPWSQQPKRIKPTS